MIEDVVKNITDKHWEDLSKKKNVKYFSGTLKPRVKNDGTEHPEEMCFRIYVEKKEDIKALDIKDIIPRMIDEIPTDVYPIGKIKALGHTCGCQQRPVTIGCSAMNYQGTGCTLGGFGKNNKEGEEEFVGVICNNHCGARENKASKGESYLYPSPYDGGDIILDKIAEHWRHVELKFNEFECSYREFFHKLFRLGKKQVTNRVDISFERLTISEDNISLLVKDIGEIKGKRRGNIGELAHKHGRTTCYTKDGKLIDNDWYGTVQYGRGMIFFGPCGLIEKDGFCDGGDSSSMILWMLDDYMGGFLFAGSSTHTIFCHWDFVEEDLEVEILTGKGD